MNKIHTSLRDYLVPTYMKQVDASHYHALKYSFPGRWVSYYHQLRTILNAEPKTALEIGVGEGVVGAYLRKNTDIRYTSLDIADDLGADVVASVEKTPFPDGSFDVVCAFEVLEHLPFEKFEGALEELKRISRKRIIISLPHFGPPILFCFKLPFLPEIRWALKIPYPRRHVFHGGHYWEIGKRGYSSKKIRKIIKKHFTILEEFIPFENQYHHFFVLKA